MDLSARVLSLAVPSAYPCNGVATALPQVHAAAVEGRDWSSEQQFPLLAWSSQAQGVFTGRYSPEDRSNPHMVRAWYNEATVERLERARELGRRKGVSANAIALADVLCQSFPIVALIALIGPTPILSGLCCLRGRYRVARCAYNKRCGSRKNPTFGKQFVNFSQPRTAERATMWRWEIGLTPST